MDRLNFDHVNQLNSDHINNAYHVLDNWATNSETESLRVIRQLGVYNLSPGEEGQYIGYAHSLTTRNITWKNTSETSWLKNLVNQLMTFLFYGTGKGTAVLDISTKVLVAELDVLFSDILDNVSKLRENADPEKRDNSLLEKNKMQAKIQETQTVLANIPKIIEALSKAKAEAKDKEEDFKIILEIVKESQAECKAINTQLDSFESLLSNFSQNEERIKETIKNIADHSANLLKQMDKAYQKIDRDDLFYPDLSSK